MISPDTKIVSTMMIELPASHHGAILIPFGSGMPIDVTHPMFYRPHGGHPPPHAV